MQINTENFGPLEIPDEDILFFEQGLYGFEGIQRYVLLYDHNPDNPFIYLQAVDFEKPCFIVLDPLKSREVFGGYCPEIPAAYLSLIGAPGEPDIRMLVIAVIRDPISGSTVNLRSPILINSATNEAAQILLPDLSHDCRHPLFPEGQKEDREC